MKKHKSLRRRHQNSDDPEENLRGKNRDLTKQLEEERRKTKALEKRLRKLLTPGYVVEEKEKAPESMEACSNCGKEGFIEKKSLPGPNNTRMIIKECQLCFDRKKEDVSTD